MKRSMIWRVTIREIQGSLGRFLAIFAIVALGVGLFAGLKITKTVFIESTTEYLRENSFYDYRILGELGFSDEQVQYFAEQEDVIAAEGSVTFDAYYDDNGSKKVGRFHQLTSLVNKVVLKEGRMPKAPWECLADSFFYGSGAIGRTITLGDLNSEEDLERFSEREFVIVGIVNSPLYLQFERGNTSLGTGSVDAFFYLTKEAFAVDFGTEVYVKFKQNFTLYDDAYKDFLKTKETAWKEISARACHERFLELPQMIADARAELETKKREALDQLDDAKKELDDAKSKINDAEERLLEGKEEIKKGWEDLEKAKQDVKEAKETMETRAPELEKGWEELEKGQKKIEENERLLSEKEAELKNAKTQLEAAKMTLQLGEMQYQLTLTEMINEQKTIDSSLENLEDRTRTVDGRELVAKGLRLEEQYKEEIAKEREAIEKERAALQIQLANLNKRYLETLAMGEQLKAGKKEFEENEKACLEGEKALKEGKAALQQAKKDLLDARSKLEKGEEELRNGKREIEKAEREIADGEKRLREKEPLIEEGERELSEGKKEYEEGLREYEDALREYEEKIAKAENAIEENEKKIADGEEPKAYVLGRDTNIGYVCFESDSAIVDGIANVFPVFFFLVAALICMTTMNRMVEEQRIQIGTLKALGYSDGRICFKFLFYSGSAAISGALFGYFSGTHVFPFFIWTVYGIMYRAGAIKYVFDPTLALVSLTVSLFCSVGTTYVTCRKELGSHAASLMRPRSPKTGKRVFLEYLPFLWKRLSFLKKVAVRNVMRYKKRFFMMVLGIGGCTALLLTGFGLNDSIAGVAEMQYDEIQLQDVSLLFQKEIDGEVTEELEALRDQGLGSYLVYQESALELATEDGQKNVTVLAMPKGLPQEEMDQFVLLQTEKREKLEKPKTGEAIVTDKIARLLGIREGSEIAIKNSARKELRVTVTGIARNYIGNYVFLDQSTWEGGALGGYEPKSVWIKMEKGRNVKELTPNLVKMNGVANVSVTDDSVKRFNAMMKSMNLIVVLVTACAAGLAFIVLFNLTNINITERIREIATIKVLGFYPAETALYVFRENFVLTVLGAFVGIGMGKWLHAFVIREITVEMVSFGIRILPQSYAYGILLTLLFSAIVSLMMNHRLEDISMTESLKSVD